MGERGAGDRSECGEYSANVRQTSFEIPIRIRLLAYASEVEVLHSAFSKGMTELKA